MDADSIFEIAIEHNLVRSIRRVPRSSGMEVAASPLEVSTCLAANHQRNGCIDGCYRLADAEQARSFATLALDFVKRVLEQRLEAVQKLDTGADYDAGDGAQP